MRSLKWSTGATLAPFRGILATIDSGFPVFDTPGLRIISHAQPRMCVYEVLIAVFWIDCPEHAKRRMKSVADPGKGIRPPYLRSGEVQTAKLSASRSQMSVERIGHGR